jgi:hypothetical protein
VSSHAAAQFLGDLHVDAALPEELGEPVAERMPPDPLANVLESRTDMPLEDHVGLQGLRSVLLDLG